MPYFSHYVITPEFLAKGGYEEITKYKGNERKYPIRRTAFNPFENPKRKEYSRDLTDFDNLILVGDQIAAILYCDLNYHCMDMQKEKRLREALMRRKTLAEIRAERQR